MLSKRQANKYLYLCGRLKKFSLPKNKYSARPRGVHVYFGFGTDWGWVNGKGRSPLLEKFWGTPEKKQASICYLYIYTHAYGESPDEGFPAQKKIPPRAVHVNAAHVM